MDDPHLLANRARWDELVEVHAASRFYDVDGFLAGRCALLPIEAAEIGPHVEGKSLCHLQCHFGLDTLSLARRGARVTGVDFSSAAISKARSLAARAGIPARFVESEVTQAPRALDGERFDVVFTSWGVLGWLPDLDGWARAVSALLAPGGTFYIAEVHPVIFLFEDDADRPLELRYPYFRSTEPLVEESDGTYADRAATIVHRRRYSWIYELGQVVTALIDAGLTLRWLREHDAVCSAIVGSMERGADGMYRLPSGAHRIPLAFSLVATKA